MNKVVLIGNLTKDPELRETANGHSVCNFDIAVSRQYTNADGERLTDFFRVTVWGNLADNCEKYLKKGNKVCVVGQLQNSTYEDKEGNKRVQTFVSAQEVEFLTPKKQDDDGFVERSKLSAEDEEDIDDDQLPF